MGYSIFAIIQLFVFLSLGTLAFLTIGFFIFVILIKVLPILMKIFHID